MLSAAMLCAAVMSIGMPNAERACEHMELVLEVSSANDIRPEAFIALVHIESRWTPSAVSHANACGLTQVIPKWTGGRASGGVDYTCEQLMDPATSIRAGARIFGYWLHSYGRCAQGRCRNANYRIGLCGYNAGYRCRGVNPSRAGMNYSRMVLRYSQEILTALTAQRGQLDL